MTAPAYPQPVSSLAWSSHRTKREVAIWLIAILVSVALHGLLFSWRGPVPTTPVKEKIRLTRINFHQQQAPKRQSISAPLPTPPPQVAEAAKPIPKAIAKPIPKPVARQRPKPIVEPKPQPIVQPSVDQAEQRPKDYSPSYSALSGGGTKNQADPLASAPAAPVDEEARQQFLALLFRHIESHKSYPAQARRRRLEGEVRVSFSILADGGIGNLRVEDGPAVLQEAASKSVRQSLPLPLPKAGVIVLPLQVSFSMTFRLR